MTRVCGLGLVTVCLVLGCTSSDMPPLATVHGKVTLADGTPVTLATVIFTPDSSQGTKGPIATCAVDGSGNYRLETAGRLSGAVIGHHIVTIEPEYHPDIPASNRVKIPGKYGDRKTSPLKVEVKAGQENTLDFQLSP